MLAKIPELKKTAKNLLLPMNFSEMNPKNARANKLKIRCCSEVCKNMAVTNL